MADGVVNPVVDLVMKLQYLQIVRKAEFSCRFAYVIKGHLGFYCLKADKVRALVDLYEPIYRNVIVRKVGNLYFVEDAVKTLDFDQF